MALRKINDREIERGSTRSKSQWTYHKTDCEMKEATIFKVYECVGFGLGVTAGCCVAGTASWYHCLCVFRSEILS